MNMKKLVKLVRLNNLQYNPNRDPAVYRRTPDEPFRVQALLDGSGTAKARLEVDGKTVYEKSIPLPGTFDCEVSFHNAGIRLGTLIVEGSNEQFSQSLRLDVMEHAWVG